MHFMFPLQWLQAAKNSSNLYTHFSFSHQQPTSCSWCVVCSIAEHFSMGSYHISKSAMDFRCLMLSLVFSRWVYIYMCFILLSFLQCTKTDLTIWNADVFLQNSWMGHFSAEWNSGLTFDSRAHTNKFEPISLTAKAWVKVIFSILHYMWTGGQMIKATGMGIGQGKSSISQPWRLSVVWNFNSQNSLGWWDNYYYLLNLFASYLTTNPIAHLARA